ncbi:MAG TPA: Yip1 family protein [Ktedonosporobacter sp.]|nr:Yip1 family protein [Ktedonosporobacter sp.]
MSENYGNPFPYYEPPQAPPPPANAWQMSEPASAPLPLGEAIRQLPRQYFTVLTKPKAATFTREQGKAAWNIIWVQLAVYSVLNTLAALIIYNMTLPNMMANLNAIYQQSMTPEMFQQMQPFLQFYTIFTGPFGLLLLVITPTVVFLSAGIFHLVAKMLGGQGRFPTYLYCYLLIAVPIGLMVSLLNMIPWAGSYLAFPASIYLYVLLGLMTKAVHRVSGGKAVAVVLIPIGLYFVLAVIFGFVLALYIISHMAIPPATP